MKRQSVERYGRGPALSTRGDRWSKFARLVLVAAVLATLGALLCR